MVILGSTYTPVMDVLKGKLPVSAELRAFDPRRPLSQQVADVDVLIIGSHRVTADVIQDAPKLRLLQQHGRGVDSVVGWRQAERACRSPTSPVGNGVAVAELCLTLILLLAQAGRGNAGGCWRAYHRRSGRHRDRREDPLRSSDSGTRGQNSRCGANALGMKVLGVRARPDAGAPRGSAGSLRSDKPQGRTRASRLRLLARYPHRADAGMIGANELHSMKASAFLVNAARGALVDYRALLDALRGGKIAGAAFEYLLDRARGPGRSHLEGADLLLVPARRWIQRRLH